jgi:hypothetical protein
LDGSDAGDINNVGSFLDELCSDLDLEELLLLPGQAAAAAAAGNTAAAAGIPGLPGQVTDADLNVLNNILSFELI